MPKNKGVNQMSEIKQRKQKKERGASVKDVIDSLSEFDGIDSIAVVVKYEDDDIETALSGDSTAELIGMLEVAKIELVEMITDAE